jgi:hypothetical protein
MDKSIKIVFKSHTNKMFMRVIRFGTRIFKIECQHVNGTIGGFNAHCCASVMDSQGVWRHIVDNRTIGFPFPQQYVLDESDPMIKVQNREAYNQFIDYIKKVYGDE